MTHLITKNVTNILLIVTFFYNLKRAETSTDVPAQIILPIKLRTLLLGDYLLNSRISNHEPGPHPSEQSPSSSSHPSANGEELVVKGAVRSEPNKKFILGSGLTEGNLCLGE